MHQILLADAARALLSSHLPSIAGCLREAVDRFNEDRALTGPVSTRTRASNVHDYASEAAERVFDGVTGVRLLRDHGFLVIVIDDTVVIRFKKLSDRLATCGIRTHQARLWAAQEAIPGMPARTHLVAGYVLDDLGEIARLVLVCSQDGRVLWTIDLQGEYGEDAGLIPFPGIDDGPDAGRATVHSALEAETESADERA